MNDYNVYDLGYSKNIIKSQPIENLETKNAFEGSSFSSLQENNRVEISPNSVIGFRIKDDNDNEVFKAMVGGVDVGDVIIGNYSNGQGLKYDKSENITTFAGKLSAPTGTLGSIEVVGNFTLGTTTVSISNTDNLQDTIDSINALGGGTIILQPGVYVLSNDITLYNNIKLEGQSPKDTILTFNNTAHSILIKGTFVYSTGTISISPGELTVVGVGTSWSSNVEAGQYILLGESDWFQITEVVDDTHLTIDIGYFGRDLSSETYKIAIIKNNISINNLGVIQSTTHGIDIQYAKNIKMFNVFSLYHGGDALRLDKSNWNILDYIILGYSARGMYVNETYNSSFDRYFVASNTGTGLVYEGGSQDNSFRFLKLYSNNIGAEIKDSNDNTFTRVDVRHSTLQGIIFNGGNHTSIDAISIENGSDGIKLIGNSDNILIDGCLITDNGGYGVNILAGTCDNTLIDSSQFKDNTSGNLNDNGTDTKIGTNVGVNAVNFRVNNIELGHASDTTLTRSSAGNVAIEGHKIYRAGGTDIPISDGGTGKSTQQTALDAIANSASGNADQVLTTNGTNASWQDASGGGTAPSNQIYTSSGTWTKPAGLVYVEVEVVGGGGGGGPSCSGFNSIGSGAGGGGYSRKIIATGSLGATETVTVGSGGAGGTSGNGGNGNTSSFGSHLSATGGSGGVTGGVGGAGGSGSNGNINSTGNGGNSGVIDGDDSGGDGGGGGSFFGGGAEGASRQTSGKTGQAYGGGGSGGNRANINQNGGAGADGVVIVKEFF